MNVLAASNRGRVQFSKNSTRAFDKNGIWINYKTVYLWMWNDTQREIMLRSGQSEKRRDAREETARRTQRRQRRR